jgi:hypothetical protein
MPEIIGSFVILVLIVGFWVFARRRASLAGFWTDMISASIGTPSYYSC